MEYHNYGCRRIEKKDIDFWKEICEDELVSDNMNTSSIVERYDDFWHYLNRVERFTVFKWEETEETPIGGFSLYDRKEKEATFGYVMHKDFRGQGLGNILVHFLFDTCKDLGIKTLKADVYHDNSASLKLLLSNGFRQMDFLEKHL
jgi:RimJ/RimL family protein N-acetyltransferase